MRKGTLALLGLLLIVTGATIVASNFKTTHAVIAPSATTWTVNLDASSTAANDVTLTSSASVTKSFRVGAILKANTTFPLTDLFGWSYTINYDPTVLVPQADPIPLSGSEGADQTVKFATQSTCGFTGSWAGLVQVGQGFGSSVVKESPAIHEGNITVFYTLLGAVPGKTVSNSCLMANVAFELVSKPSGPQLVTISDVQFLDSTTAKLNVISGTAAIETITNSPPVATFTVTPEATGSPDCTPLTGSPCSAYAFMFDGSASSDPEDVTIASTGFNWDFGDGTNDQGATGAFVVHDYGAAGKLNVTLRVVDSAGATGSARDALGTVFVNQQPSHTFRTVVPDAPPTAAFGFTPANPAPTDTVTFDASTSTPGQAPTTISQYTWSFGDGSPVQTVTTSTTTHAYSTANTYTVTLTVTDSLGVNSAPTTQQIIVAPAIHPTSTTLSCDTPIIVNQASTCTATVTDTLASPTAPTGMVSFTLAGTATGTLGSSCTLSGSVSPTTCTVSFVPSGAGTADISGSYGGDVTHNPSSTTTAFSITVNLRTTLTTINCTSPVVVNQVSACTATVSDMSTAGTPVTPTGIATFTASGSASGTFGFSGVCTLTSPTATSAACTVPFTPSTIGTAEINAAYTPAPSDTAHSGNDTTGFPATITVGLRTTATTVTCDTPVTVGTASSCTVTIMDTSSAGTPLTPTGSFSLGTSSTGTFSGPCDLSQTVVGTASCPVTYTPTVTGTHTLTANYPGDAAHSSSSGFFDISVTGAALSTTATTVSCDSPVALDQASTCTATVTDTGASPTTPTGSVSFTSSSGFGSFSSISCTLSGTSSASCQVTYTQVSQSGTVTITASYGGDSSHATSSGRFDVTATLRTTTTSVSCVPGSVQVTQLTTCTVTVTDTSPGDPGQFGFPFPQGYGVFTSSGAGSFSSSTTPSPNVCALSVSGTGIQTCSVTYTPSAVGTGTHTITADYSPFSLWLPSSGIFDLTVTPLPGHTTTTTVSCDTPVVVNQASTCTATVTDTSTTAATSPSGTVSFSTNLSLGTYSFDSTTCDLVPGTSGTASCSVHFNPLRYDLGPVSVSARYGGDSTHNGSDSSAFSITVNGRAAVTTLTCDTPVSLPGSSSCTVTVTDTETAGSPLTPSGDVQPLTTNSTGIFSSGFCGLTGSGASSSCAFSYTPSVVGDHNVTAYHLSDGQHLPSSAFFVITVNPSALHSTSTSLICDTPVVVNQASICTVAVTDADASPTAPTGTVTFTLTSTATGTLGFSCTLLGSVSPTSCTVSFLPSGSGTADISAGYGGDTTHNPSSTTAAFSITVDLRTTSTTITCDTPVTTNTPSSCTVTVMDTSTAGTPITPTGTFDLTSSSTGTFSGPCILSGSSSSADCVVAYTPTVSGPHRITADYPGDTSHDVSSGFADISATSPVNTPPEASFTESHTNALTGVSITFDASASNDPDGGTIVNYAWDFGDGTTGSGVIVTHAYGTASPYTVTLVVTDGDGGATGTLSAVKTISDRPPVARFTETASTVPTGTLIIFDASASADPDGTITAYAWDFGDGNTGTGVTASHPYATANTYVVTLTVTDNSGNTNSIDATKTIQDRAPEASFTESTTAVLTQVSISFDASASSDPDGTVVSYAWSFGDGSTAFGPTTSHDYAKSGSYTVTLTVTDDSGNTGTSNAVKTISDRPPVAKFTVSSTTVVTGTPISFDTSASFDPDGTIVSYAWNFGDTFTGTGVTISHTYNITGTYTATLTVTDDSGSTGSTSQTITVTKPAPSIILTFQAFDADDFDNGIGELNVTLNGHLVVNIPAGLFHLTGTGSYAPFDEVWANLGPFDITSFTVQGTNTLVFSNPLTGHYAEIRNVLVVLNDPTILLDYRQTREVTPTQSVTLTFSNPPIQITSFTVSPTPVFVTEQRTFTATYTGGVGPFKCTFNFGDGGTAVAYSTTQSCSVVHTYWLGTEDNGFDVGGNFTAAVKVQGATSGAALATLPVEVLRQPKFTGTGLTFLSTITTPTENLTAQIANPTHVDLLVRIDFLVYPPGDVPPVHFTSPSFLIPAGQTRTVSFTYTTTTHGFYYFQATLTYGVDLNSDGTLQNAEVLGDKAPVYGHFLAS